MKYPKFCLVLGGGGTKGSYEVGVWQALRELGVRIEAVVGTSIGALNALLVAQDDFEVAENLWNRLTMDQVLRLPANFQNPQSGEPDNAFLATFSLLGKLLVEKGELDNSPLKELIESLIDFSKLAKTEIDLGLVTFNLSKFRGEEVFLWDLAPEQLADYLRASAAFPGFKKNRIGKTVYIDGGVFDNIPYRTARKRGYKNLIVVDVTGLGNNRPLDTVGTQTILIRNSIDLGHVLDFRPDFIQDFKRLGYLDTLKVFERLDGVWYFLKKETGLWRRWNILLVSEEFFATLGKILPEALRNLPPLAAIRKILPKEMAFHVNPALVLLECAASALKIPRIQLYSPKELLDLVLGKYEELMKQVKAADLSGYKNLFTTLGQELKDTKLTSLLKEKAPLELDLIMARLDFPAKHPHLTDWFNALFPQVRAAKVFFFLYVYYRRNLDRIPFLPKGQRLQLKFQPLSPPKD